MEILKKCLESNDLNFKFSGILADLGMSSFQLDNAHRGFSFKNEGPLDMRMDQKTGVTAKVWINNASEDEISKVLWQFGEEKYSRKIARAIISKRMSNKITTTQAVIGDHHRYQKEFKIKTLNSTLPQKHFKQSEFTSIRK